MTSSTRSERPKFRLVTAFRERAGDALPVAVLLALVLTQPLLDLMTKFPEILVAHQLKPGEILVLVAILALVLPLGAAAITVGADRLLGARGGYCSAFAIAVLLAVFVLLAATRLGGAPSWVVIPVASLLAALLTRVVRRRPAFRTFFLWLSPALLVFPLVFVLSRPVAKLVFPDPTDLGAMPRVSSSTPVFLIVFDELPLASLLDGDSSINANRFPAFAELAGQSHWFRNASTVALVTSRAVPAILTGGYPTETSPSFKLYPRNVFTWLGSSYKIDAFEVLTELCPEEVCENPYAGETGAQRVLSTMSDLGWVYLRLVVPPDLSDRLPEVTGTWRDFGNPDAGDDGSGDGPEIEPTADSEDDTSIEVRSRRGNVGWVFSRFLESIEPPGDRTFHFIHVNLPHRPWRYLPSGRQYGPVGVYRDFGLVKGEFGERKGNVWSDNEWLTLQALQRHLLQLGYADRLLGLLLHKLREVDLFDRAAIFVVADHGASFWPGQPRRDLTPETEADVLRVPLLVKEPFQKNPSVHDRVVETIDIVPTIADLLGEEPPWPMEGQSVFASGPERRRSVVFKERVARDSPIRPPDKTRERIVESFGAGEDPLDLYRIGPYRDLVGRRTDELPGSGAASVGIELLEPWSFEDVDRDGSFLPARVIGTVLREDDGHEPVDLAVALNGTIVAVTRSFVDGEREEFMAMLPEQAFRDGRNELSVYCVLPPRSPRGDGVSPPRSPRGDGVHSEVGTPVLAATAVSSQQKYELIRGADGRVERISLASGEELQIRRARRRKIIGEVLFGTTKIHGWAVDLRRQKPAETILMFYDDQFVARSPIEFYSPQIAEEFGRPQLRKSGFRFIVPYGVIGQPELARALVFAVSGNDAVPLPVRWGDRAKPRREDREGDRAGAQEGKQP